VAGEIGYAERSGDRRCEGFFSSPVSASGLEVVSVTFGPVDWEPEADRLYVGAPDLSPLGAQALQLRAVGLPPRLYYRLDATIASGGTLAWPVADVLAPGGLRPDSIGVYGWIDGPLGRVFVPVVVSAADAAESATVVLTLRSFGAVDRLLWREFAPDGQPTRWAPVTEGRLAAGANVAFDLPDGESGLITLEFRALRAGTDDWVPLRATIWRPER
jgi:hypothetical protein